MGIDIPAETQSPMRSSAPGSSSVIALLLRRFATESAREEARLFCDEVVSEDEIDSVYDDLIAA